MLQTVYQKANSNTMLRSAIYLTRLKYWDLGEGFGLNTSENIALRLTYMAQ